jgi:hypothetical protein
MRGADPARGPGDPPLRRRLGVAAVIGSAVALGLAPLLLPPGYSVVTHSVSEAAAQATSGAWLARSGLAVLGAAALLLAGPASRGSRWARPSLVCFGGSLLAAAIWSHSPWLPQPPADPVEDLLHSVASGVVGLGFVSALLAMTVRPPDRSVRWLSLIALLVSIVVPLLMAIDESRAGLWQRLMFGTAMVWLIVAATHGAPRDDASHGANRPPAGPAPRPRCRGLRGFPGRRPAP